VARVNKLLAPRRAPDFHGGGQLALLEGELARQDAIFADPLGASGYTHHAPSNTPLRHKPARAPDAFIGVSAFIGGSNL